MCGQPKAAIDSIAAAHTMDFELLEGLSPAKNGAWVVLTLGLIKAGSRLPWQMADFLGSVIDFELL